MRQRPSYPGFFQARLHINSQPRDTFIKLPVSRTAISLQYYNLRNLNVLNLKRRASEKDKNSSDLKLFNEVKS